MISSHTQQGSHLLHFHNDDAFAQYVVYSRIFNHISFHVNRSSKKLLNPVHI